MILDLVLLDRFDWDIKKWDYDLLDDAGFGGYTYLLEPLWWVGLVTSE